MHGQVFYCVLGSVGVSGAPLFLPHTGGHGVPTPWREVVRLRVVISS